MNRLVCRACRCRSGDIVLDLGAQPAGDEFPPVDAPRLDPRYPLRMWLCEQCGLSQLAEDTAVAAEHPVSTESRALARQRDAAIAMVAEAGLLPVGGRFVEFSSPHGNGCRDALLHHGMWPAARDGGAEVVVDYFGLMHEPDQDRALRQRAERLTADGVLLLEFLSLSALLRTGQWNLVRHGHFAYHSMPAISSMLAAAGLTPVRAWRFDLYGGTVLLAARRGGTPDVSVSTLLAEEEAAGVTDPNVVSGLQDTAERGCAALADWLSQARRAGERVVGYGAASRSVTLLSRAGVTRELLPAIADASPAKHGRRMPGSGIPIVPAESLRGEPPRRVLVFVPDIVDEVRAALPELSLAGTRWAIAEPAPRFVPPTAAPN